MACLSEELVDMQRCAGVRLGALPAPLARAVERRRLGQGPVARLGLRMEPELPGRSLREHE